MGYNHAQAEKRFLAEWRIQFRIYRQNGLTLEQILPLYKMYKAELRSDRCYYEQTEPLTDAEHDLRVAEMPVLAEYDESNWLDVLPDELAQRLSVLPEERLRAFYLYRVQRYTQKEAAVKFHKSQVAVHHWIRQIAEIIEKYKSNL